MDYLELSCLFADTALELSLFQDNQNHIQKTIEDSVQEIERMNERFFDRNLLFQSITGINPDKVIYSMRLGKTQEEAIKSQNPSIVILSKEELDVQLNLLSKELRDYKSLPRDRFENLIDFYVALSENSRREFHHDRMYLAA